MRRGAPALSGRYIPPVADRTLTVVSADGARLHTEVYGPQDAPAVVLSHGWTCSTAFWAAQVRDLAAGHRVIVYDQRGHGRSPLPADTGGYSARALADDLEAVLDATLEPGRRAVVVGHSMGGMTIMAAAGRPAVREHAAAVLLCSTGHERLVAEARVIPLRAGRLRDRLTRAVLASRAPLGPVTPLSRRLLRYGTMGRGATPEMVDVCARIVHACPRRARCGWAGLFEGLDLTERVRALDVPTAVVVGRSDRLTPAVLGRGIAACVPDCAGLTELPGIGHMTPIEAPDEITRRIRELSAEYVGAEGAASA
ncbi:alpha/beta fold hydrolase [Streptomyces sp. NPDC050560]|uniref:alpha/beta fold hydrolase n=1 Tax=Streptomyces sp. NPDC050560 TaxID=3365630 RepID=UPI0037B14965